VLLIKTGCGSAWLERHVRDVEAVGSNPTSPISLIIKDLSTELGALAECGGKEGLDEVFTDSRFWFLVYRFSYWGNAPELTRNQKRETFPMNIRFVPILFLLLCPPVTPCRRHQRKKTSKCRHSRHRRNYRGKRSDLHHNRGLQAGDRTGSSFDRRGPRT
jgi:hypothetical protein